MKSLTVLAALLAALAIGTPPAEAAVVVRFEPTDSLVLAGSEITIDLVADITIDPVVGFDLNLVFDPSIADLTGVVFGPSFDFGGLGGIWDDTTDQLIGGAFPDAVIGDDIVLASLTFKGLLAEKITTLNVSFDGTNQGFALEAVGEFATDVTVQPGTLRVPEPATLALVLPALFGAGMLTRRRRAA